MNRENILILIIGFLGGIVVGVPAFMFLMKESVKYIARHTASSVANGIEGATVSKILTVSSQVQGDISKAASGILETATDAIHILKDFVTETPTDSLIAEAQRERGAAARIVRQSFQAVGGFGDEKIGKVSDASDDPATAYQKTESLVENMNDAAQDLQGAGDAVAQSSAGALDELCEREFASVYHFDAGDSPSVIEFKDCVQLGTIGFGTGILLVYKAKYSTRAQSTIDEQDGVTVVLVRDYDTKLIEAVFVPLNDASLSSVAEYFRLEKGIEPQVVESPFVDTASEQETKL